MAGITFESMRLFREFSDVDHRLHDLTMHLIEHLWPVGTPARVTCIFRTKEEEEAAGGKSGIHTVSAPFRAVDIGARELTSKQIAHTAETLNARWIYDPLRPNMKVCFAKPHGTGPHFHLQVHPRTRRR